MTQIRLIFADFFQIYPRKSANICVISVLIKKCKGKNATCFSGENFFRSPY